MRAGYPIERVKNIVPIACVALDCLDHIENLQECPLARHLVADPVGDAEVSAGGAVVLQIDRLLDPPFSSDDLADEIAGGIQVWHEVVLVVEVVGGAASCARLAEVYL